MCVYMCIYICCVCVCVCVCMCVCIYMKCILIIVYLVKLSAVCLVTELNFYILTSEILTRWHLTFECQQSVQSKQESLLQRLDELDNENNELRLQAADLEEAKEQLQEELTRLAAERDGLINAVKEKQASSVSVYIYIIYCMDRSEFIRNYSLEWDALVTLSSLLLYSYSNTVRKVFVLRD